MPLIRIFIVALAFLFIAESVSFQIDESPDLNLNPLTNSAQAQADQISHAVSTTEWLGPLAPIALSPFFGITCLSGMAMFSEGMPWEGNAFISENSALSTPWVFWAFLTLTILTSLPRLTKVSKPVAQALDQVEAYGGIITLIVLRIAAASVASADPVSSEPEVVVSGLFSITYDMLMIVAMAINIIVINTIKFFFEVLIWITPIPFVDAVLEAANKLVCAVLMTIYAFSPLLATIINLILFTICAILFRWVYRRVVYMRRLIVDPVIALLIPSYGNPRDSITVFPKSSYGPFAAKAKLHLTRTENGWHLIQRRWILPSIKKEILQSESVAELYPGLLLNKLVFPAVESTPLVFSRRFNKHLDQVVSKFNFKTTDAKNEAAAAKVELA